MDSITLLACALLFFSSITSVINIGILLHLLSRGRTNTAEKNLDLNSKEFNLMQRQYVFLQANHDVNLKRLDVIEKVLSVLVVSNQFDDIGGNGILN